MLGQVRQSSGPATASTAQTRWRLVLTSKATTAVAEVGLLGLLPAIVYFVFQAEPFSLQTAIDGMIYAGYSQHLGDLIARYGFLYFSVRFGLILPARAASAVFGAVPGYFVMRYGLAALAGGSLYLLARRLGVRPAGWLGYLVLLSSPIFVRALMTFYSDTVGLPMVVVALCCLLMPSERPGRWYLVAGLAFGIAINANLYVAGLAAVVVATSAILHGLRRDARRLLSLALVPVGTLVVTAAGALYYREAFGLTNVLYPSWRFFVTQRATSSAKFRAPTYAWLDFDLYIYIPLLILLAGVLLLLSRFTVRHTITGDSQSSRLQSLIRPPLFDGLAFLAAAESFYVLVEFGLHGYEFEYFFYASYLWAFGAVALTLIAVEVLRRGALTPRVGAVVAGALALIPLARHSTFPHLQVWAWPGIPIMAILVAALMVSGRSRPAFQQAGLTFLVGCVALLGVVAPRNVPLSPGQMNRADAQYDTAIGSGDRSGLDVYEVSLQLMAALPSSDQDPGTILFWYRSHEPKLSLIQATYLWLPNTLQAGGPGLPTLSSSEIAELRDRPPRRLVLLGLNSADISSGRNALEGAGIGPKMTVDRTLHAGTFTVYMESMLFDPVPCVQQGPSKPSTCG